MTSIYSSQMKKSSLANFRLGWTCFSYVFCTSKSNNAPFFLNFLVYYVICSYADEIDLYSKIISFSQLSTNNAVFIFLRWSPHFASFYTTQYVPDKSLTASSNVFPVLHLLPIDTGSTSTFNNLILNYEQQILANVSNVTLSDDVSLYYWLNDDRRYSFISAYLDFEWIGKCWVSSTIECIIIYQPGHFE